MRWLSDAGRRFWQAYCQGLEMSCPMQCSDQWLACERDGNQAAAGDATRSGTGNIAQRNEQPTVH